jgi:hypothetical protein
MSSGVGFMQVISMLPAWPIPSAQVLIHCLNSHEVNGESTSVVSTKKNCTRRKVFNLVIRTFCSGTKT